MMGSVCEQQHNKFHQLYLTKKALREIDIPPRKLLGRRSPPQMLMMDSPKAEDNAAFSKFLPYNNVNDEDDDDPYSSDHFRIFEFKVRKCNRSRSHDWTDCPFAHPGEKARRRDPRRFHYSGTVCSEYRKGHCGKGDNCEFSHGVFECWLHPSRYRTEACKDGKNCKRKVCFFAHSTRQLRIVPEASSPPMNSPKSLTPAAAEKKLLPRCCVFCHSMTNSPTSTLVGMSHVSPPASPPFSPDFLAFDRRRVEAYGGDRFCGLGYKEAMNELMASFEAMNVAAEGSPAAMANRNLPFVDVNDINLDYQDQQPQFVLSPSVPAMTGRGGPRKLFAGDSPGRNLMEDNRYNGESSSSGGPDLGWVNDLLT
ncbi:hypothetical protein CASFOL_010630 [Castilleja foliolosa]|uniref:C3H1-type domain-containing protein n=1 Tax=Castilleja foliolosa TaxID=1961234 RepID=A0ABD3DT68_9LAMI